MLLKRIFLGVVLVMVVSLQTHYSSTPKPQLNIGFETKEGMAGTHRCSMVALNAQHKQLLGSLCVVKGSTLALFASPVFEAIDKEQLPSDIINLIDLTKKIQTTHDLHNVVALGDIYVPVEQRGHGCAQKLVNAACTQAFDEGATLIVLIPDPFEYEQGIQKSLQKSSDYEEKKERLIALYQKCGFEKNYAGSMVYMYRKP